MHSIASCFPNFLRLVARDEERSLLFLRELWPNIAGKEVSGRTVPRTLHNGRLEMLVSDPAWLQPVKDLESSLRDAINRYWGFPLVERIHFVSSQEESETRSTAVLPPAAGPGFD